MHLWKFVILVGELAVGGKERTTRGRVFPSENCEELTRRESERGGEAGEAGLNVLGLLVLKRQDGLLDWAEGLLRDINELRLVVLQKDEVVIVHLDLVLLQQENSLFHRLDLGKSLVLDGLDITEVSHHLHEQLLLLLSVVGAGNNLDAVRHI